MSEEKNIIQIINETEKAAIKNIEDARAEAEKKIEAAKIKIARDKEAILKNFKEKMANIATELKPQSEKIKKENQESLTQKTSDLETKAKKNTGKAANFLFKKLME